METEPRAPVAGKAVKMSDRATIEIRQKIISGEFPPGMKLLESDLAKRLGFSKVPVREALLRLERDGLIVMAPSRSAQVFDLGPDEIADLSEVRRILESQALILAADRNGKALAAELEDIAKQMKTAFDEHDVASYKLLDYEFHGALFRHCGNAYLRKNFETLSFRVQALRNRLSNDQRLNRLSLADHQEIPAALRDGRTDTALEILERHIAVTTENYLAQVTGEHSAYPRPIGDGTAGSVLVDIQDMERFCNEALIAASTDEPTARTVTRALMHASVHGVDTHGVRLLPHYIAAFKGGRLNTVPEPRLVAENGAVAVMDGDDAHGARATYKATEHAIELARTHGVGAVAIRRSSHFGAAGAYAVEVAHAGLVGIVFGNSDAMVRLHSGAEPFHGTNPIAIAAPTGADNPWLFDMATSAVPYNRVALSRWLGIKLASGVASDQRGQDTADPHEAVMLAPLGGPVHGYKGAGLAGVAEIFSSAFSDSPLSVELAPMVSADMSAPRGLGAFVMAVDPAAFLGLDVFKHIMDRYLTKIRASHSAENAQVMAPGDREWDEAARRRKHGILIDHVSVRAFSEITQEYSISPLRVTSA